MEKEFNLNNNEMKATIKFENNYLDLLIDLIINNSKLNYDKNDLRIYNEETIMQIIKIIAKDKYENRLEDLKNKETKKDEE